MSSALQVMNMDQTAAEWAARIRSCRSSGLSVVSAQQPYTLTNTCGGVHNGPRRWWLCLFCGDLYCVAVSALHLAAPGHLGFQQFVGQRLAVVRQHRQQVVVRIDPICFCGLHDRVNNRTGFRALCGIAEEPVLSTHGKGPDGVLRKIVGNRYIPIVYKRTQRPPLVLGILHRRFQLACCSLQGSVYLPSSNTPSEQVVQSSGGIPSSVCC